MKMKMAGDSNIHADYVGIWMSNLFLFSPILLTQETRSGKNITHTHIPREQLNEKRNFSHYHSFCVSFERKWIFVFALKESFFSWRFLFHIVFIVHSCLNWYLCVICKDGNFEPPAKVGKPRPVRNHGKNLINLLFPRKKKFFFSHLYDIIMSVVRQSSAHFAYW